LTLTRYWLNYQHQGDDLVNDVIDIERRLLGVGLVRERTDVPDHLGCPKLGGGTDMSKPRPLLWSEPSAISRYAIAVLSVALAIVVARASNPPICQPVDQSQSVQGEMSTRQGFADANN
jgi:hypothetical protein